jgi:hypothetical protein
MEFKHHKANGDPHTCKDYSSPNAKKREAKVNQQDATQIKYSQIEI